jgi:transcriptional regulator with XRE-family HTH domain
MISQAEVGIKVRELRISKSRSQQELAQILDVPRSAVSKIENGERALSSTELIKLSHFLEVSIDELFKAARVKNDSGVSFNKDKFRELVLYITSKCGAKPNVGLTVLYKLLYFSDFDFYEIYGRPISGMPYRKIARGPAPSKFQDVVDEMTALNEITLVTTDFGGHTQKRYIPNRLGILSREEERVVNYVITKLSSMNATEISEYSHGDAPWRMTNDNDIIDYNKVFERSTGYSVRDLSF